MTVLKPLFQLIGLIGLILLTILPSQAQVAPEPPDPPKQSTIESILAKAPQISEDDLEDLHIVLLAGKKDHGLNEHDYPLWQKRWSLLLGGEKSRSEASQVNTYGAANKVESEELNAGAAKVTVSTAWDWPTEQQFEQADLIVAFAAISWTRERNVELEAFLSEGGGFVVIHMACVVGDGVDLDDEVVDMIGLTWNWDTTRWRHGPMNLDIAQQDHPICLGLPKQLYFMDEAYWPLYGDRSRVNTIATSKESTENFALRKPDGSLDFSNMGTIQQKWPEEPTKDEPIFWTYEYGKGRAYGCILGHYMWTFDDPYFRILMLRGMAWAAGESPYRLDPLVLRGATVK
ncbi:MAG: ThuA domain-containing protein [Bacteroidota bacterium]